MKFWLRTYASIAVCIVLFNTTRSQSKLEVTIQQFPAEQVAGYIQPLGDMLGANMNAGLYHSAAIDEDDFHLRIDVIAMASLVRESDRTYDTQLPAGFVPQGGSLRTATIFGGEGTTFSDISTGMNTGLLRKHRVANVDLDSGITLLAHANYVRVLLAQTGPHEA